MLNDDSNVSLLQYFNESKWNWFMNREGERMNKIKFSVGCGMRRIDRFGYIKSVCLGCKNVNTKSNILCLCVCTFSHLFVCT